MHITFLHIALVYLAAVNVLTFCLFGIDKFKAQHDRWRLKEAMLIGLSLLGGSIGAWLGMKLWHHKTLHNRFRFGVPLIILAQIIGVLVLLWYLK